MVFMTWRPPDVGPPQTKQKTQPSCQPPLSQAMLAEQGSRMEKPHLKKDIQGNVPSWIWPCGQLRRWDRHSWWISAWQPVTPISTWLWKGSLALEYMPKSPVYPCPTDDSSEESSALYHDSARDQMTPKAEEPQENDMPTTWRPKHVNADKDHFQNTMRQKLGKELSEAPWERTPMDSPWQS